VTGQLGTQGSYGNRFGEREQSKGGGINQWWQANELGNIKCVVALVGVFGLKSQLFLAGHFSSLNKLTVQEEQEKK